MRGLTVDQIADIRRATEELLSSTGVRVQHEGLCALAREAGATVDDASGTVRLPPLLLRELLERAPSQYTVATASGAPTTVGGDEQHALAIVTDPWILDYDTNRPRRPALADVQRHTRIAQRLDEVVAISLMDYPVTDAPGPDSNLRAMEAHLLEHDKHINVMPASHESLERWLRIGGLLLDGGQLRGSRLMTVGVATLSPLVLTGMNGDLLLTACEHDLPVVPTVCPMAGTTAPYSKAGTVLMTNAEAVFLAALTQLVRPGHPFLFAFGPSRTDLRTGADLYYTLDKVLWKIAGAQLARTYGLPAACECGGSMPCRYDVQTGAEGMLFMLAAVEAGADLLAGIGSCGNAVAMSGEMMLLQSAWLRAARFLARGLDTQAHLGLDSIRRAGPGRHYLDDAMTLELLRADEFFDDPLLDYGDVNGGQPTMLERARQAADELVAHSVSPRSAAVQEALRRFFHDECARVRAA